MFFKKKKVSDIVQKALNGMKSFEAEENPKNIATIHKYLGRISELLFQNKDDEENQYGPRLVAEVSHDDFIPVGLSIFPRLPAEPRRQFTNIFTGLIAFQTGMDFQVALLIQRTPKILDTLISFYEKSELACCAGEMIRICIKHANLSKLLRDTNRITKLASFFTAPHFDISSDSIKTFEQLILSSPQAEEFLQGNSSLVFQLIHSACDEPHYAACRSLLKLIHEIIFQFGSIRETYTSNEKNLILIMRLMSSQYQQLRFDAYHVFKYFIVDDKKAPPVEKILISNAKKLIDYLNEMLKTENEDLIEERNMLILSLQKYL